MVSRRGEIGMKKILNMFFYIMKYILLILGFVSTLYIIVYMYQRLNKPLTEAVRTFLPYLVLFILFCINLVARQKGVTKNLFYNICCCLVLVTVCYCGYRAIFDQNMIMNEEMGYHINFNYYSDFISPMKIMLYGLSVANICFMFRVKENRDKMDQEIVSVTKEKKVTAKKKGTSK